MSESLFNQPVACSFSIEILRRFFVDIVKLSITPFLQEHLETLVSVFMEHIRNNNIIKLIVNYRKWLFERFQALVKIEISTCEIKIT